MFGKNLAPPPGTVVRFNDGRRGDGSAKPRSAIIIGTSVDESVFVVPLRSKQGLKTAGIDGPRIGLLGDPWHTNPAKMRSILIESVTEIAEAVTTAELASIRAELRGILGICPTAHADDQNPVAVAGSARP